MGAGLCNIEAAWRCVKKQAQWENGVVELGGTKSVKRLVQSVVQSSFTGGLHKISCELS